MSFEVGFERHNPRQRGPRCAADKRAPRLQRRTTVAVQRRSADPERGGHPPQRVTQRGLGEPGHAPGANAGRSHGLGAVMQPRPASGASREPTSRCDEAFSRELRTATYAADTLGVGCRRAPPMTIGGQARKRGAPRLKGQARPYRPRARQGVRHQTPSAPARSPAVDRSGSGNASVLSIARSDASAYAAAVARHHNLGGCLCHGCFLRLI